jgi:hypothetical protein
VFGLALASALIATFALPFAEHEVEFPRYPDKIDRVDHLLTETSLVPLVVTILIVLGLVWAARGRLIRAVLLGPVVSFTALCTMIGMAIQHLFSRAVPNLAETTSYLALFAVFVLGAVIFVVEWIVVVAERRHLEADDPVFPTARQVVR